MSFSARSIRVACIMAGLFSAAAVVSMPHAAPAGDELAATELRAKELLEAGRPREAVEARDRALAIRLASPELAAGPVTARLLEDQARTLEALEEYGLAEWRRREALQIRQALHGEEHPTSRNLMRLLAATIRKERPDDAEAESLLLRVHALEPGWATHRDLGLYYRDTDRRELAIEHLVRAAELAEDDARAGLWRVPMTRNELARIYREAGLDSLAEGAFLRSLAGREAQHGERNPWLAGALREIGEFYIEQERWIDAESQLLRALELKEAAYGQCDACNRDVAALLGEVYTALGRTVDFCAAASSEAASARPERERAADTERTLSSGSEPDVAQALTAEALEEEDDTIDAMLRRGEYAGARETAELARIRREEQLGEDSLEAAASLLREARAAGRIKRYEDELELRERRLRVLEARLGVEHAAVAAELEHLALAAERGGLPDRAADYLEREILLREAAGQTLMLARATARLGDVERARGNERAAADRFLHAADSWEQAAGRAAGGYVEARIDLAESYRALGLLDEAEATLTELLDREAARDALRLTLQVRMLESLEQVHEATGDEEARRRADARLEALRGLPRSR